MSGTLPRWASVAAVVGGVTWIPIRLGVSVAFSTEYLRLTYVEWNKLMVVPLGLLIVATVALAAHAPSPAARFGGWVAVAGIVGMLAGVIVEFWVFGGLAGNRDGAVVGWLIYLLGGVLVHVIGLAVFGIGALRTPGWRALGLLALLVAALHVAWLPAGVLGDRFLVADQVLIGLGWVGIGLLAIRRPQVGPT